MKEQSKPKGFPLWALAIIIPAAGVLLLCCVGGVGFVFFVGRNGARPGGGAGNQQVPEGMTLAAYLAQRPDAPTMVTARCNLTNYYNWAYARTAATHYCVSMFSGKSGHAWVPKDSEAGRQIFEALNDGKEHRLTLEVVLQGPDGTPTPPGREEMAITKMAK